MLSRTHPLTRRLRALRDDPAMRASSGVFVAEGIHLAADALAAGAAIEAAVVSARLADTAEGRALAAGLRAAAVPVHETTDAVLDQIQDARSPQPVVVLVKREAVTLTEALAATAGVPLVVVACGVQDPGNLGALWRTANAAGATALVATPGSASLTHPRTVRASMGAIYRMTAVEAGIGEALEKFKSSRFKVYGAEARGAVAYEDADWNVPLALFLGGEGAGLPDEVASGLDARVGIPMAPGVESLSVNAAAAVLLFAAARARSEPKPA